MSEQKICFRNPKVINIRKIAKDEEITVTNLIVLAITEYCLRRKISSN
jgi:hypothetical protein